MRLLNGAVVAIALVVGATAVAGGQGFDKKATDKLLADGAKKLASANPAEREQGVGYFYGSMTCAYKTQYQPLIVKALKDPSPKVRAIALQTLEKVAADAIPEIALLLEDPVGDVQERAAYALGTIGDKSAEPFLIKARDNMRAQKKNTLALTMQEGLDEISGKSPTEHTKCP